MHHSDNANSRGIEVYVTNTKSVFRPFNFACLSVAGLFKKETGFESRGVKFANFQVLQEAIGFCPSLLLELGFLSNKDEGGCISDYINIERIASAILLSIKND